MNKFLIILLSLIWQISFAQKSVTYSVNLDNIVHHELRISVLFEGLGGESLLVKMPNASPGRYAEHQFAKNVYDEQAFNGSGEKLTLSRITPNNWEVKTQDEQVRFEYTLYANHADGTYSGVDANRVHLNIPATFIYADGFLDSEIQLSFDLTSFPNWQVATQLPSISKEIFTAPNFAYFYDSPIMIGEMDIRSWKVEDQTIEVAMMHEGSDAELDAYVLWIKSVVNEEIKVFGGLPSYDYGRYTFLCSYSPWVFGDAMEHRNSTFCIFRGALNENSKRMIGSIAHEFIHSWNIERIRPADLEPFNFDQANVSQALWFGEGFTNYYEALIKCRTGIISKDEFLANLEGLINSIQFSPARELRNPIQMSQYAPFADAATSNDETNRANTFISYYTYGELLGAGLDLLLRTTFKDISLDTYMKRVWEKFGKTEIPYSLNDLKETLAEVTKNPSFAADYFNRYIYDSQLPDYQALLGEFGIETALQDETGIYWGNSLLKNGIISSTVLKGSPFYEAGVEKGDQILSIDGKIMSSYSGFLDLGLKPGNRYEIKFLQLGKEKTGSFVAKPNPEIRLANSPTATKKQKEKLNLWLQSTP